MKTIDLKVHSQVLLRSLERFSKPLAFGLLFWALSWGQASATPWYDELLFCYRKKGEIRQVEVLPDHALVVDTEHPFWLSVLAFYSMLGDQGALSSESTAYNWAVYLGPWTEIPAQNVLLRYRLRLLIFRLPSGGSRLYLAGELQKQSEEEVWNALELKSNDKLYTRLYQELALGLSYARYSGSLEDIPQVIELAKGNSNKSLGKELSLPPKTTMIPPQKVKALMTDDYSKPEILEIEKGRLQKTLDKEMIEPKEFEFLQAALESLEP